MTNYNKDHLIALLQSKFGYFKPSFPEIQVNCPFCEGRGLSPNTTRKLGIHLVKEIYHCFRCDAKGKLSYLFPSLPPSSKEPEPVEPESLEPLPTGISLKELIHPWNALVYGFLNEKGFPAITVEHKIFFVDDYHKKEYSFGPRLVFPIYQSGKYRGFQARTLYRNTNPKYIGASGMDRKSLLYNYDQAFRQSEQLVLTEGFFDQMRVGDTAVATLGKIIADDQIRLIKLGTFKRIIIFLDKDAEHEAYQNAARLKMYFPTYIARFPTYVIKRLKRSGNNIDPGAMTKDEINDVFTNHLERVY